MVILLHGKSDIHSYVDVAPLLASAGYRAIVPYLRGCGTTRFLSALLAAHSSPELFWKIPLTYTVPFAVSFFSSIAAARSLGTSPRRTR